MKIIVFSDESGSHDLENAKEQGSQIVGIGGYSGFTENWATFCGEWQSILNKYRSHDEDLLYFHFYEWAMASAIVRGKSKTNSTYKNGPYFGWSLEKLDSFLSELSIIAGGGGRFPFGQSFNLERYHTAETKEILMSLKTPKELLTGPFLIYLTCFHEFFALFLEDLGLRHPTFNGAISFVFDQKKGDVLWERAAHQMFYHFRRRDPRMSGISFADKKALLPLQAADMISYRLHQMHMTKAKSGNWAQLTPLDLALWGYSSPEEAMAHFSKLLVRPEQN